MAFELFPAISLSFLILINFYPHAEPDLREYYSTIRIEFLVEFDFFSFTAPDTRAWRPDSSWRRQV